MTSGSVAERNDLVPSGPLAIDRGVLATTEVVARVLRIQEVMRAVMKEGTHFGTIPGTPKPTLYKPGAELLLMTFRIAATPAHIEDLSTPDEVRYRVTMRGTNQLTGEVVGEMLGECSSSEEKYRWRKPVCQQEWEETDPSLRRAKWRKGGRDSEPYKETQVRTSPADVANTILKMAVKRAFVALALSALGASDIFAQDLEDLTEELREAVAGGEAPRQEAKQPQRKSDTGQAAAVKPAPANALVVVGLVEKVGEPAGKKFSVIKLKGDSRNFSAWNDSNAAIIADAKAFVGTAHKVKLLYIETKQGDKTYCNAVGISIADADHVTPPADATKPSEGPITTDDANPFREPGAEG